MALTTHVHAARKPDATADEIVETVNVAIAVNAGAALVYSARRHGSLPWCADRAALRLLCGSAQAPSARRRRPCTGCVPCARSARQAKPLTAAVTRRMKIASAVQHDSVLSSPETVPGGLRERHRVDRRPPPPDGARVGGPGDSSRSGDSFGRGAEETGVTATSSRSSVTGTATSSPSRMPRVKSFFDDDLRGQNGKISTALSNLRTVEQGHGHESSEH